MLVFIIPVKSPEISTSWIEVCRLFERCLRSVCNQTSSNFKVLVVCNEKPKIAFYHPKVKYLEVDFPVPSADYFAKMDDRSNKVVAGLLAASEFKPSHVMIVDADDCISNQIAAFVNQNPQSNGWFVDKGYEYIDGSKKIYFRRKGFYKMCGTCNIINYKLFTLPKKLKKYYSITEYDAFLTGHSLSKQILAERGTPIQALPFSGTIYIRDRVGESATLQDSLLTRFKRYPKEPMRGLKRILLAPFNEQNVTAMIREEFSLYTLK
ncbi:hypothetical protein RIVM261_066900 [Rivularia sp. IAM M-261]|nr:hypothetical protein RIVM261_066900 [Rivularia sp. IAM M-261]